LSIAEGNFRQNKRKKEEHFSEKEGAFQKNQIKLQISYEKFKKGVVITGNLCYHMGWKM
jgi:hypothetical protein